MRFLPFHFVCIKRAVTLTIASLSCVIITTVKAETGDTTTLAQMLSPAVAPPTVAGTINTFEQDMINNLRDISKSRLAAQIQRANPENKAEQPVHFSRFSHTTEDARAAILQRFPVGTSAAQILQEFPRDFVIFEIRPSEHSGVYVRTEGQPDRIVGSRSLIIAVDKYYPSGVAPIVLYRNACLAFNKEGELVDIIVIDLIDSV